MKDGKLCTYECVVDAGEGIFPTNAKGHRAASENGCYDGRAGDAAEVAFRALAADVAGQEAVLKQWAIVEECWIESSEVETWGENGGGIEARVYPRDSYAYKVGYNYLGVGYQTPLEWIANKIILHNRLFPEDALELVGFTETYGFVKSITGPFFAPVFRQKWVDGQLVAKDRQALIDDMLRELGWTQTGKTAWMKGFVRIKDIHTDNVIIDRNGDYHFIDTQPEVFC